jgi:hypothetical protein
MLFHPPPSTSHPRLMIRFTLHKTTKQISCPSTCPHEFPFGDGQFGKVYNEESYFTISQQK